MNYKTKAMALGAVLALAVGASSALASPGSAKAPTASPPKASSKAGKSLGEFGIQGATLVLLNNPCRVLDTRQTKKTLVPGVPLGVQFTGSGLTGGGESNCNIPDNGMIAGVQASISAVAPSATGYLRLGVDGIAAATELNYQKGQGITTGAAIPLCTFAGCVSGHQVNFEANQGGTDLVVDVQGYYLRPTATQVEGANAGTVAPYDTDATSGMLGTGALHTSKGVYVLAMKNNVATCALNVTAHNGNRFGQVSINDAFPNTATVLILDAAGNPQDADFSFVATC
ncbi:MAG: hypothetical protein JWN46_1978 [Acidimicrobiales bacterium]|nr:hypothetical protein [Acidimicrobiales bacterium]